MSLHSALKTYKSVEVFDVIDIILQIPTYAGTYVLTTTDLGKY